MKDRFLTIAGAALLIFFSVSHPAYALKIAPFKAAMVAGETTKVFHVENNSDEPAAVQVSIETWTITPEGEEFNTDAEDDFTVFPAQLVLKPHERRAVRIQYLGEAPATETAYRVLAEQIPIALKDTPAGGSGLKFLLRFKAGLYIGPVNPQANVVVEKIETVNDGMAKLTLVNKGNGHTLMREPVLTLAMADGKTVTLKSDQMPTLSGMNMHAGISRVFYIPIPSGATPTSANLEFGNAF